MKIAFDNLEFPSQKSVVNHVSNVFAQETLLTLLTGHALSIACELYARIQDTPAPVRFMLVQCTEHRELQFDNGAGWVAISIEKAVRREAHSGPKLTSVLRSAIQPQTMAFRDLAFSEGSPVCAISGQQLSRDFVDVDHVVQFKDIVQEWLDLTGGEKHVAFVQRAGGGYTRAPEQLSSWQRFHADCAVLRLLDRNVHRAHTQAQQALAA